MTDRSWHIAKDGKQAGPYPEVQLRDFIAKGIIDRNTLVWTEGMSAWQRAGDTPGLFPSTYAPPPPAPFAGGPPAAGATATAVTTGMGSGDHLEADFGVWSLLGRYLLYSIGTALIVTAPLAAASFYRWLVAHIRAPGRPDLAFEGKAGDIWWVFVLIPISLFVPLIGLFLSMFFSWLALKWVIRNISSQGRLLPLSFTGGYWGYLGWYIFLILSTITIIGWAWVAAAWMRWICRHIAGSTRGVSFTGTGWQILWRTVVFELLCVFIIPIPWMLRWYARWYVSQIALG